MGFGVGARSKRFALVTEEGMVKHVATDDGMDTCENTSVESILKLLSPIEEANTAGLDLSDDQTKALVAVGAILAIAWLVRRSGAESASNPNRQPNPHVLPLRCALTFTLTVHPGNERWRRLGVDRNRSLRHHGRRSRWS